MWKGKLNLLMRRHEHSDKEEKMLKKIKKEYVLFKYKMLSSNVREVYNECNCIRFFECLHEYFLYKEKIDSEFVQATADSEDILQELWEIYLKYEYLRVDEWSGVEEILRIYTREKGS